MASPVYVIENGLRSVKPYYMMHKTHVKTRWVGRTILDVFTQELGQQEQIVRDELQNRYIYVLENFGKADKTAIIEGWDNLAGRKIDQHDVVYSKRHMHEPSVVVDQGNAGDENCSFQIVYRDQELLVVNKPSGIPTHPTANYRYNTVVEILKYELAIENLWPCHRLDKMTSGVLIFGLNKDAVKKITSVIELKGDNATKQYVARVKGEFPPEKLMLNCPIFLVNASGGYLMPTNLETLPANSCTEFKRLKYNEQLDESIVQCTPISGKMHQIRIHLRNIGFPICNDAVYSTELTPINQLKNDVEAYLYQKLYRENPSFNQLVKPHSVENTFVNVQALVDDKVQDDLKRIRAMAAERLESYRHADVCPECKRSIFDLDRDKKDACIWLHSYRYELNADQKLSFETELPVWCNI